MKTLIFSGLVLGASAYLVATQSDLLHDWIDQAQPAAKQLVSAGEAQIDAFTKKGEKIVAGNEKDQQIEMLKQEIAELKSQLAEHRDSQIEADKDVLKELNKELHNEPRKEAIVDTQVLEQSVAVEKPETRYSKETTDTQSSPGLMPIHERSEALIALANRMEMKAAGL